MSYQNPNQMLVEDEDLRGVVIGVMRHHLGDWPPKEKEEKWPVYITVAHSAAEVLNENGLVVQLQESSVKTLGIIVDANASFETRWQRIRSFCQKHGATIPSSCPPEGLVVDSVLNTRFGAWIMPNNKDSGMLENFCQGLVPTKENEDLWAYAKNSASHARSNLSAPFIEAHIYKAQMHTWLAWQNPPGERMGSAITKKILKPDVGSAKPFADWFCKLYGVK